MPEICRFFGIRILMYFNDHNPPHFHVEYSKYNAIININNLGVIEGNLPPRALSLVVEWATIHKKELLKNWHELKKTGEFKKIKPLK